MFFFENGYVAMLIDPEEEQDTERDLARTLELIRKFGFIPSRDVLPELRELLRRERRVISGRESGCGDYARALCFMLYAVGEVEDCLCIWSIKRLNMDTGCYIDGEYLFGAGVEATLAYVSAQPEYANLLAELKEILGQPLSGRETTIDWFRRYFDNTEI